MRVKVKADMNFGEEEKGPTSWNSHVNATSLKDLLRPSLLSMVLCGCYSFNGRYSNAAEDNRGNAIYRKLGIIWRICVFLACLTAFAKGVAAFVTLPRAYTGFNITMFAWYTHTLVVFLISLKSSHIRYGGQRNSFEFWDTKIRPILNELGIKFPKTKVNQRQTVYLVLATMVVIANIIGTILLATGTVSDGLSEFFTAPFSPSVFTLFVIISINLIISLIWVYPLFYTMLFATVLTSTFQVFNEFLENYISRNALKMPCEFHKIRLLQLNLSKMISELDRDFGYYYATIFVFAVGNSCFILYQILRTTMTTLNLIMYLFWLVASLAETTALFVFAAFVNEAVSRFQKLYILCKIKLAIVLYGSVHPHRITNFIF